MSTLSINRRNFIKTSLLTAVGTTFAAQVFSPQILHAAENTSNMKNTTMFANIPNVLLNNGNRMPQFGLGTWTLAQNTTNSVIIAAEAGYRLFDTAQGYQNEKKVGEGLKQSGLPREEIFITTKIAPDNMRKDEKGKRDAIDRSIEVLGGQYIDLFLIHWPVKDEIQETWQIFEEYVQKGLIKNIGISNFNPHHIDDLLKYAKIKPVLNQIEIHPYNTQENNVTAIRSYGMEVEAWSPLAQSRVMQDGTIGKLANKYGKSPAQITLRWELQRGLVTIPRSKNPAHIRENINIFDFVLSEYDMNIISNLNRNQRINPQNDPDNFPW